MLEKDILALNLKIFNTLPNLTGDYIENPIAIYGDNLFVTLRYTKKDEKIKVRIPLRSGFDSCLSCCLDLKNEFKNIFSDVSLCNLLIKHSLLEPSKYAKLAYHAKWIFIVEYDQSLNDLTYWIEFKFFEAFLTIADKKYLQTEFLINVNDGVYSSKLYNECQKYLNHKHEITMDFNDFENLRNNLNIIEMINI
jgi:hypothetical protein